MGKAGVVRPGASRPAWLAKVRATTGWADVMADGSRTDQGPHRVTPGLDRRPLQQQITDHRHEPWVDPYGGGTHQWQAQLVSSSPGFDIQVVHHLHVIADEPNRRQDHGRRPLLGQ